MCALWARLRKNENEKGDKISPPDGMDSPYGMCPPDGMDSPDGVGPPDGMDSPDGIIMPGEKIEDLQCEGLRIIVRRDGFHYGTDSVLLANYVKAGNGEKIIELCSGMGAVSILLAAKTRAANITGLEIQESLVDMAMRSAALNKICDRVRFISGDVRRISNYFEAGSADAVVVNPPYISRESGAVSGDKIEAIARHEIKCDLFDVICAANWLLNPGGCLYVVHRPERLVDLFYVMRSLDIEPKELQPAGMTTDKPPSLVLVRGKKSADVGLVYLRQILL